MAGTSIKGATSVQLCFICYNISTEAINHQDQMVLHTVAMDTVARGVNAELLIPAALKHLNR